MVVERDRQRANLKVVLTRPQMSKLLSNGGCCSARGERAVAPGWEELSSGDTLNGRRTFLPVFACEGAQRVRSTQRVEGVTLPPFLAGGFTPEEEVPVDPTLCRRASLHFFSSTPPRCQTYRR